MVNTTGTLDPPFGNTRLQVMKLFVAMVSAGSPELSTKIVQHDVLNTVLVSGESGSAYLYIQRCVHTYIYCW